MKGDAPAPYASPWIPYCFVPWNCLYLMHLPLCLMYPWSHTHFVCLMELPLCQMHLPICFWFCLKALPLALCTCLFVSHRLYLTELPLPHAPAPLSHVSLVSQAVSRNCPFASGTCPFCLMYREASISSIIGTVQHRSIIGNKLSKLTMIFTQEHLATGRVGPRPTMVVPAGLGAGLFIDRLR